MVPRTIIYLVVGVWLLVAVAVVGYPLRAGNIRVGFDPVSRDSAPKAFWYAYILSTVLFLVVSVALGFFVRSILT
jgi:nitrate reductase NapE component